MHTEHHHHHHHHHEAPRLGDDRGLRRVYILSIVLNLGFVVVEALAGILYKSLGLVSDAGHNLSDVAALLLALVALRLMHSHSSKGYTYGYRKSSVLISLANAVLLLVAVGAIIIESIRKFSHPEPLDGAVISWTAGIGILINGFTALLLMKAQHHDLNAKGAYLHMLADTLVSVGVVISGIVISLTGWYVIDPLIGLAIAVVILAGTWGLLKESVRLSIDAVPEGIDAEEIAALIRSCDGVLEMHHLHIWALSTTETALTAHLVVEKLDGADAIVHTVKDALSEKGIRHSTLELETADSPCSEPSCC